jgi:CRISPR/Cas system CSM-associated protein Csm2 small subunit
MGRNELMNLATSMLGDFIKENPEQKAEVHEDIRLIKSTKLAEHEAEIEKIKNIFVSILRDIKKDIGDKAAMQNTANAEFLQKTLAGLQELKPKSAEEVAEIITNMVKQATPLEDAQLESFKQFATLIFGNKNEQND